MVIAGPNPAPHTKNISEILPMNLVKMPKKRMRTFKMCGPYERGVGKIVGWGGKLRGRVGKIVGWGGKSV